MFILHPQFFNPCPSSMASNMVSLKDYLSKKRKHDKLQETVKNMQNLMECPVCLDLPHSRKIYSCEAGHPVCEPDLKKLAKGYKGGAFTIRDAKSVNCPTCVTRKIAFRNLLVEKVLHESFKILALECRFSCGTYHCLENMPKHEELCSKRQVQCPGNKCKWEGPLDQLINHGEVKCLEVIAVTTNVQPAIFSSSLKELKNSTDGWKPVVFTGGVVDVFKPYLSIKKEERNFKLKMNAFLPHELCQDVFSRISIHDFGKRFTSIATVNVDSSGCTNHQCSRNSAKHQWLEVPSDMLLHAANDARDRNFILQFQVTVDMQNELRPEDVKKWETEIQKLDNTWLDFHLSRCQEMEK